MTKACGTLPSGHLWCHRRIRLQTEINRTSRSISCQDGGGGARQEEEQVGGPEAGGSSDGSGGRGDRPGGEWGQCRGTTTGRGRGEPPAELGSLGFSLTQVGSPGGRGSATATPAFRWGVCASGDVGDQLGGRCGERGCWTGAAAAARRGWHPGGRSGCCSPGRGGDEGTITMSSGLWGGADGSFTERRNAEGAGARGAETEPRGGHVPREVPRHALTCASPQACGNPGPRYLRLRPGLEPGFSADKAREDKS